MLSLYMPCNDSKIAMSESRSSASDLHSARRFFIFFIVVVTADAAHLVAIVGAFAGFVCVLF